MDDNDAAVLAACMAALEHADLYALVCEETGARRLLPRRVYETLAESRGVMHVLSEVARGAAPDEGLVARQRDAWSAVGAFALDGLGVDEADAFTAERNDVECLLDAADNAFFEARERWGQWMLAIGVAAGLAYQRMPPGVEPSTVGLACVIGDAADWCDERAAVEELNGKRYV